MSKNVFLQKRNKCFFFFFVCVCVCVFVSKGCAIKIDLWKSINTCCDID